MMMLCMLDPFNSIHFLCLFIGLQAIGANFMVVDSHVNRAFQSLVSISIISFGISVFPYIKMWILSMKLQTSNQFHSFKWVIFKLRKNDLVSNYMVSNYMVSNYLVNNFKSYSNSILCKKLFPSNFILYFLSFVLICWI